MAVSLLSALKSLDEQARDALDLGSAATHDAVDFASAAQGVRADNALLEPELLAALKSAGVLDNLVEADSPPEQDRLWLDTSGNQKLLEIADPISLEWVPATFDRLFNRNKPFREEIFPVVVGQTYVLIDDGYDVVAYVLLQGLQITGWTAPGGGIVTFPAITEEDTAGSASVDLVVGVGSNPAYAFNTIDGGLV